LAVLLTAHKTADLIISAWQAFGKQQQDKKIRSLCRAVFLISERAFIMAGFLALMFVHRYFLYKAITTSRVRLPLMLNGFPNGVPRITLNTGPMAAALTLFFLLIIWIFMASPLRFGIVSRETIGF